MENLIRYNTLAPKMSNYPRKVTKRGIPLNSRLCPPCENFIAFIHNWLLRSFTLFLSGSERAHLFFSYIFFLLLLFLRWCFFILFSRCVRLLTFSFILWSIFLPSLLIYWVTQSVSRKKWISLHFLTKVWETKVSVNTSKSVFIFQEVQNKDRPAFLFIPILVTKKNDAAP